MTKDLPYGVCGVYCGQCPTGNGRVNALAEELLKVTTGLTSDTPDYEIKDFDVKEFRKGLEYFHKSYGCPTCLNIEEPWCEVLRCEKAKELGSCLLCDDFTNCSNTEYHRDRYPYLLEHHRRVKKVGLKQHNKEEQWRAEKGVSIIDLRKY